MHYRRHQPYRLIEGFEPLEKTGIEILHRRVLAELKPHGCTQILNSVLASLSNSPRGPHEVASAPWLTLLIAKWAMQDPMVPTKMGRPLPQEKLTELVNLLWNAPLEASPNVWLLVRSNFHVQYQWQVDDLMGFIRWPALIARQHPNSLIRRQFVQTIGMEPDDYIDLSFALSGGILNRDGPLNPNWLNALRNSYPTQLDGIVKMFAHSLHELRHEMRSDEAQRIRGRSELYEFPYLKRYPLLLRRDGLHVWHSKVFKQGVEDAVDMRMSVSLGEEYSQTFSKVFEQYVTELSTPLSEAALTEKAFWSEFGRDRRAAEVVIPGKFGNVFIEAKMSLYADEIMLTDDEAVARQKTFQLRDAFEKAISAGNTLRSRPFADGIFDKLEDFLIIVTSRSLLIRDAQILSELYRDSWDPYKGDAQAAQRMPLLNAVILGISDFEKLIGAVRSNDLDLSKVLRDATRANADPMTGKMLFLQHLPRTRWGKTPVLWNATERSLERLSIALGQPSSSIISAPDDPDSD